ncbi:MAG TPA: carboxypeptidase-like regulatory domain-containing protein, partial [Ferruginibacter sp.]|nr:carboxypeptidase-like regulatory domain-containing protein [Ferruginibacter sp.]
MRTLFSLLLLFGSLSSFSQTKTAWVSGRVIDENENPMAKVSVVTLGKTTGITTNDSGYFRIKATAGRSF